VTLGAPLAIVDIETTGSDPAADRITEIAVLEIDGFEVSSAWSTLVNPGVRLPSPIQALTGITEDMLAGAPRFAELADGLLERLKGRLVVAHNARFDYGFLRREFERAGHRFHARALCSVRLSRRLYPQHARHDLDSLIERHGLDCAARHRAHGDAEALWHFLRLAATEHGEEILHVAARQVARQVALPPQLERAAIDAIPEAPGVYLLHGEGGAPLYVGKSRNMRQRVLQHFAATLRSEKEMRLAREVRRIDWQRTTGELGALLREARLVKELAPAYNRQLRTPRGLCGFVFDGKRLRLADAAEIDAETLPLLRGLFRSRRMALSALRELADAHRLCLKTVGFDERGSGVCFRHQVGRCAGVCAGRENVHLHHARLAAALAQFPGASWPHAGPLGIVEIDRGREATEVHVVDRWCYVGSARSDDELAELLEQRRTPAFDYDHYRILARHLARPGVRTRPLAA